MSDEYASTGFQGSLVNDSVPRTQPSDSSSPQYVPGRESELNAREKNYPSQNDSTSSGGSGSSQDVYSRDAQRGHIDNGSANLVQHTTPAQERGLSGIEDARQGGEQGAPDFGQEVR